MGRVYCRSHHSHCHVHGKLSPLLSEGKSHGGNHPRRGSPPGGCLGRTIRSLPCRPRASVHPRGRTAGMVDHPLRIRSQHPACLVAAGAARLPEHLYEAGHDLRPRLRHLSGAPRPPDAGHQPLCGRLGPCAGGENFSVLLHHHRLRGNLRISFPDF